MIYNIRDCIDYVHDAGKITEMLYDDLINELDKLYENNEEYENMIYGGYDKDE